MLEHLNNLIINGKDYVVLVISILLILYSHHIRIVPPQFIKNLFGNNIFRVVFLSLLLIYKFEKAPHVSIFIALVFVLTMHFINKDEIKENFQYVKYINNINNINNNKL